MTSLDNLRIQSNGRISDEPPTDSYVLRADQGLVLSTHELIDGAYEIVHYQVNPDLRGKNLGYGKELLRAAHEHAVAIGARALTASNITNEASSNAFAVVFGEEYLSGGKDVSSESQRFHLYPFVQFRYPIE